jgi:hypothetical protein
MGSKGLDGEGRRQKWQLGASSVGGREKVI